jgi:Type I restriction-modification system methyltransferase subunit
MANEATATDQFVRREIEKFGVKYDEQTSSIPEVKQALKGASKTGGKGVGKPEFVFLSDDNLIIIENKLATDKLEAIDSDGNLIMEPEIISSFAVNGAVHYATHIVQKTNSFKEVIAIGVTGDENNHLIQPYFVSLDDNNVNIEKLIELSNLQQLHPDNINEWYSVNVLKNETKEQQQVLELQKVASELHEDLRNYGSLEGENKATVVSAILLALYEKSFSPNDLKGENFDGGRDGDKILNAINTFINREGVLPHSKTQILMNKFAFIKTNVALNAINTTLQMTPLKYFTNKLNEQVLHHFAKNTDFDILGNFYGEFVKYGGSDGNSLGIVLTPRHITTLMAEIIEVHPNDYVLDPACGSGAFLISAMNRMVQLAEDDEKKVQIKQKQLLGIEMQEKMFTVATTNMILRGDGKSNLQLADMFKVLRDRDEFKTLLKKNGLEKDKIEKELKNYTYLGAPVNKILFNPPYSQGKTDKKLTEISFINHALDLSIVGGKLAAIVPQSTMVGKSKEEVDYKRKVLKKNTLEMVITCNKDTFRGIGVNPCIAVFTTGIPHPKNKQVKFINFEDDGMIIRKHVGLIDDGSAREKREYLLDVINGNIDDYSTKFMVKSTITADDEWLHSFYYFNEDIPSEDDFVKSISDYLAFKFDMYVHGKGHLFEENDNEL